MPDKRKSKKKPMSKGFNEKKRKPLVPISGIFSISLSMISNPANDSMAIIVTQPEAARPGAASESCIKVLTRATN